MGAALRVLSVITDQWVLVAILAHLEVRLAQARPRARAAHDELATT